MKKTRWRYPFTYITFKERFDRYIAYQKRYKGLVSIHVTFGEKPENAEEIYKELLDMNMAADNKKRCTPITEL